MFKNTLVALVMAILCSAAFAGWQSGKVERLLVHDNDAGLEKFDVKLTQTSASQMTWCDPIEEWAALLDNEASKAQYSLLLSAMMAGKEIRLHSDSTTNCHGERNRIRNVEIYN